MDNLTYSVSGLNIISNISNETVRFNCKNSVGTTVTAMNVYNNVAQLYYPTVANAFRNKKRYILL